QYSVYEQHILWFQAFMKGGEQISHTAQPLCHFQLMGQHAFAEGRTFILAGVPFENFPKGPNTKRSDGDVVAHAIVMSLAGATNTCDIDDWFPEKGETGVRSMEYLPEMRQRLIEAKQLVIVTVDLNILCREQP